MQEAANGAAPRPKPHCKPAERARDRKQAQTSSARVDREDKQRQQLQQAEDQIGQSGGDSAAAHGPQQIIDKTQAHAGADGAEQLAELQEHWPRHQPNMRCSRRGEGADS